MKPDTYHLFETAAGYCAIAWNDAGIIRLQLPATEAATIERHLRRRTDAGFARTMSR
jgi:methylated-DNA-[protein]-cysteine S-methyltransferase